MQPCRRRRYRPWIPADDLRGRWRRVYSLETEIDDATAVLDTFTDVRTLFGWNYGGLIALHLANARTLRHVVAYEPAMAPFGKAALPHLQQAHEAADSDATAEIALREVTGMNDESIQALRADRTLWDQLRRLSDPLYAETNALNGAAQPGGLATGAERVDPIVGERNRGRAPYGTSFEDVVHLVPQATVHQLAGQAHLAHLEAPSRLATLLNSLANATS